MKEPYFTDEMILVCVVICYFGLFSLVMSKCDMAFYAPR